MALTKLTTSSITGDTLAAGDIAADAITASELANNAVDTAAVADDAITTDKLANSINSAITANTAKTGITSSQTSAITANTAKTTNATHSGEVTGATALTIADNIVDEANLKVSNSATNGHFLSAQSGNSGGLTWAEAGGGDLVLLASANASNSGDLSFGNSFSSAYYNYVLYFSDVVSTSNPDYFGMRLSTSSGFWDGGDKYGSVKIARRVTGDPGNNDESTGDSQYDRIALTVSAVSNNSNWAISGCIHFNNPQSAESYTICDYRLTHGAPNGSPLLTLVTGAGNLSKPQACTGVRFLFESGNISTGHFRLYGVKNA